MLQRTNKIIASLILVALFLAATLPNPISTLAYNLPVATAAQNGDKAQGKAPYVPGELIVQYKDGVTEDDALSVRNSVNAKLKDKLDRADEHVERENSRRGDLEVVTIEGDASVDDAIAQLSENPAVAFAEPNYRITVDATANDQFYANGTLWGMYGDDQPLPIGPANTTNIYGSAAEKAWDTGHTGSRSVYVGVIDEGIDHRHPDLGANVWTNQFDQAGDGVDNDGNGYVDDTRGWDFHNNDNTVYDGTATGTDIDTHGTHVAGTIGALGNNSEGVVGVNWEVTMIPAKAIAPAGGDVANTTKAINYLVDLKRRHNINLVAINNSYGGGGYSQAMHEALIRAAKADILIVASAGNSGLNTDIPSQTQYPAAYNTSVGTANETAAAFDAVISVGSINGTSTNPALIGVKSSYSNFGVRTVDLAAQGNSVQSTLPSNTYGLKSGTSMAAPHVTGAAALYKSVNPSATAADIRKAILDSTQYTASLEDLMLTAGRLDIGALLSPLPAPPAAPSGLTSTTMTDIEVSLNWTDNSANERNFLIERCPGTGCTNFVEVARVAPGATTYTDRGLVNSTLYTYRVRAVNRGGASDYSNELAITTLSPQPPIAPTGVAAYALSREAAALIAWTDGSPNDDGFRIERCAGTGCSNFVQVGETNATTFQFKDTTAVLETLYNYRVRAFNAGGNGVVSNVATVTTAPATPSNLRVASSSSVPRRVTLQWTDNSAGEIMFRIERCSETNCTSSSFFTVAEVPANSTTWVDSDFSYGPGPVYTYRLAAIGSTGISSPVSNTAVVTLSPLTAPSALTNLAADAVATWQVDLTWTDTSDQESYFSVERCEGRTCTNFVEVGIAARNERAYSDTTASRRTTYRYQVRAVNSAGSSAPSNIVRVTTSSRDR